MLGTGLVTSSLLILTSFPTNHTILALRCRLIIANGTMSFKGRYAKVLTVMRCSTTFPSITQTWLHLHSLRLRSSLLMKAKHGNRPISKKYFRPGGMALSEWIRSVRAVRDTPVADDSAPGINTTRRVAYRPPIVVLLFLFALSVSYFKRTLWH